MRKLQTLAFAIPLTTFAALAFATPAFAWHVTSTCSNSQWIVGIPNESWANGTTATFDFNQGPDATLGKGQATTAPAAATSVTVSFNNSGERLSASRPAGCVVAAQAATTTTTTTTLAPVTTVGSSSTLVAFDTELTPVVQPPVVVAVAEPPVPQPQGVSAASSLQRLPVTGPTRLTWMLGLTGGLVGGGILVIILSRKPHP